MIREWKPEWIKAVTPKHNIMFTIMRSKTEWKKIYLYWMSQ